MKDHNFPILLAEVEQSIASGNSLFDTTNTALLNTVGTLFQSAAFRLNATQQELPVNMFGSGRNYTFNNSGTAYSTVIGVYKDDEHLEKITVEGLKIVPTSLTELWTGYGGASGSPVDHDYSLVGDGDFTFKFRTGKPGFGDGSPEHDEAFKENLAQFSLSLVLTVLPATPIPGCYLTIKNNVYNTVSAVTGISSNSNVGMGTVLFTVAQLTLNNISSLVECTGAQLRQNWFSSLLQQFNFIQKAFGVLSNGANTTIFGTQWALSEAVMDVCFSASGTEVNACSGCDGETIVTDAEGNIYKIVEIGSQCWMAENLKASGGIPQVSDPAVWRDAYSDILGQQPAWCYYDNDPANGAVYGKLYNWYAVNTVNLCPLGWHVPTNADWNKLRDYLDPGADGNDNTAGRKMKTTTGWFTTEGILPPNESTNESGFTALPGGLNGAGSFGAKGSSGYWWSSTDLGNHYQLYDLRDELRYSGTTSPRGMGFSCRCIKD